LRNSSLLPSLERGYFFVIWYRDGTVLERSADAPLNAPIPEGVERDTLPHFRSRGELREAVFCSGLGECMMIGRSLAADPAGLGGLGWSLLAIGGTVLALGLGVGWWITSRAFRPLEEISEAAVRISRGQLSERIVMTKEGAEVAQLAAVLNRTFARLEAAFMRQQQFTADAAHELRMPLTILISETQTTLARERSAAEYRETVEGCLDTAQQMRMLTETLLDLARLDNAETGLTREKVDLATAARDCVQRLSGLAEREHVTLRSELQPVWVMGVRARLEQVITNLLSNAISYNKVGGEVRIACGAEGESACVTVADTGIGISSVDLPHIFDRFYRADRARSRAQGHTGLGLAICKTVIEAEGGTIDATSTPQVGTTLRVRLPLR
jgi:heavy metal sensor kinase